MSPGTRRVIVGLLLVLYAIWPLVQHQLVMRERVDPWKLAGWAMYAAPTPRVRVRLRGIDEAGQAARINPRGSTMLAETIEDFAYRRRTLGLFVPPDSIANQLIVDYPLYREWTVVVEQVGLMRDHRFGVIHRSVYRYPNQSGRLGPAQTHHPTTVETTP